MTARDSRLGWRGRDLLSRTVSSTSFGIHSELRRQQGLQRLHQRRRNVNIAIAVASLFIAACTIGLIILHLAGKAQGSMAANMTKLILRDKEVGSAAGDQLEHLERLEHLEDLRSMELRADNSTDWQETQPEPQTQTQTQGEVEERRDHHPNHRYDEPDAQARQDLLQKMMASYYTEGWRAERPGSEQSLNNIQDIIQQFDKDEDGRATVLESQPPLPSRPPMPFRLRGVYIRPSPHVTEGGDRPRGTEQPRSEVLDINRLLAEAAPGRAQPVGSPFTKQAPDLSELYTKAIYHPFDRTQPSREMKKKWTGGGEGDKEKRKKPLTVMLDIYPMSKGEEDEEKLAVKPGKEVIYVPIRPGAEFIQPQIQSNPNRPLYRHLVPPNQRRWMDPRHRMVMQLNLFPRHLSRRRHSPLYHAGTDARIGEVFQEPPEGASRRIFSFFKKKKTKEHEEPCDIVGHKPGGKPIGAKWRNQKGEWVHAKYVALKQWDDKPWWWPKWRRAGP